MKRFSKDGRLIKPLSKREKAQSEKNDDKVRYVLDEAYCPNGCNILDVNYKINGLPGMEGEFVISAIEGDFDKIILSGELKDGVKDDLYCPHCDVMFEKLVNCNCKPDADMIVIGLTPKLDFNNSISFCNITGCENGTFVKSSDVIRHIRLKHSS